MRTLTLLLCVLLLCVIPAFAQQYDLLLKGGHVIDPKNDVNAVRDVAIKGGPSSSGWPQYCRLASRQGD